MLCQNCNNNEATTHIKRIVNGSTAEYHLCSECAANMGYGARFTGVGFGDLLGSLFGDLSISRLSSRVLRCETCGCTFDDIVKTGKIGCSDCYRVFYDKLQPSVIKLHGQVKYCGKIPPRDFNNDDSDKIAELREELNTAIKEQNFEKAAVLRDEIKRTEALKNE